MPSVQPWTGIHSKRMSSNINSPPFLCRLVAFGLSSRKSGLCFELVAATEARVGLVSYRIHSSFPPVMASAGGRALEQRQYVMLFLASCFQGFVRKLGEILGMAVSMWGAGYNGDGFSRQSRPTHTPDLGHIAQITSQI